MKNNILYLLILLLGALINSCDDSFLNENRTQIDGYNLDVPLFVQPVSEYTEAFVTLPELKNKDFKVFQYPKIIHFETLNGHIDETGKLTFRIKIDDFESSINLEPNHLGDIILNISDFGFLKIAVVHLNPGIPKVSISESVIDFGKNRQDKYLNVINSANGFLWYRLADKPSWLQIKKSNLSDDTLDIDSIRVIYPYDSHSLVLTPDVEGLLPGEHEDQIVFETSDESNPVLRIKIKITVLSYENPETIMPIEGIVVDSEFDKNTNTLYILTQNPNKLISYNIGNQNKSEIFFDKNVKCISFSEDKSISFVGMSEKLVKIDMKTFSVSDTYPINFNVHDILYDENNSVFITYHISGYDGNEIIYKLNLNSGEYKSIPFPNIYANTNMVKINGQPEFFASREVMSPNGVIWVNYSSGIPELKRYWHTSIGENIWMSENQQFIYAQDGRIFKFPSQNTGDNLSEVGRLKFDGEMYYYYLCYNNNSNSNSIWASYNKSDWLYKNVVFEFDQNTYQKKREIELNDYVTFYNGKKDYYKTVANRIFTNTQGNKLILIKNIVEQDANAWHLEIIDVTK